MPTPVPVTRLSYLARGTNAPLKPPQEGGDKPMYTAVLISAIVAWFAVAILAVDSAFRARRWKHYDNIRRIKSY